MKIVLVQFRIDKQVLAHEQDCILRDLQLEKKQLICYNALKQDLSSLEVENFDAFIFGGSGELSISQEDETIKILRNNVKVLIDNILKQNIPSLFICLGFHILSDHQGQFVKKDTTKAEIGTTNIYLTPEGITDPLFNNLPKQFKVQEAHNDAIHELPQNAVLLAESKRCLLQAYKIGKYVYAVQFHPELQREDMFKRLSFYSDMYNTDHSKFQESKDAVKILENFKEIIKNKEKT